MNKRWKSSNKAIFNLAYHVIFCPKYRRKVLVNEVESRLKSLLQEKCTSLNLNLASIEIMPDHVHLFIKPNSPVDSPHNIVGQLKGYSSRILRTEFPHLKSKLPSLWTRSYFIESVGCISEDTIIKYIQNQKNV
jgi:putative transposase